MKKLLLLTLTVSCLALQPMSAQKKEGTDNFKYYKAKEILDKGGDPQEARKLATENIKGKRNYITASGDIHEGTVLRLKEVKLGDAILKNVEASVVHSQKAPLLLGQSVLEKFGTITIDNVNSKLLIKQ